MKLYNSIGPNPHVVRMFMAEKGIDLPKVDVDLRSGENRQPPYTDKVNIAGQTPALELPDGATISEITVICEYLEEKHPTPALIGTTPEERAEVRMWTRRVDLNICEPMANGFRASEGRPMFESRMKLVGAEGAAELKAIARDRILWLDSQIAGRDWIVPGRFSLADILLFCFLAFGGVVGQPIPDEAANIKAWFARVGARPSAAA
ncbi:MAG TPA: glutathione S-transferase family protein [Phenylobacterium sp.]|nr:glutathione S-transferase family protein [Phenylobacterium sp.]